MNFRFTSERQLGQKALDHSSQAYDKQLLSKIGGPNTPTRTNAPPLSSSAQDSSSDSHTHKLNGQQLKPLSVPDRLHPDSPATKWPQSGAISPGYTGFRSPVFDGTDRGRYGSISTPGPLDEVPVHRDSYDHSIFSDHDLSGMEEHGIRNLHIEDRSPAGSDEYHMCQKGGLKRRASSPPPEAVRDDRPTASGERDLYHRRSQQMLVNRTPASRFQMNHGSLSSVSSSGPRTGSVGSSLGYSTAASSMTSYGGDQHLSPSALSPSGPTELGPASPYAASSRSLNPSPRGSLSRPQHQRGYSESEHPSQIRKLSTESILHSRQNSMANRIPGAYICECCPKKPKKFDSEDELR